MVIDKQFLHLRSAVLGVNCHLSFALYQLVKSFKCARLFRLFRIFVEVLAYLSIVHVFKELDIMNEAKRNALCEVLWVETGLEFNRQESFSCVRR